MTRIRITITVPPPASSGGGTYLIDVQQGLPAEGEVAHPVAVREAAVSTRAPALDLHTEITWGQALHNLVRSPDDRECRAAVENMFGNFSFRVAGAALEYLRSQMDGRQGDGDHGEAAMLAELLDTLTERPMPSAGAGA
jgi:hypothetical protein